MYQWAKIVEPVTESKSQQEETQESQKGYGQEDPHYKEHAAWRVQDRKVL